jgi:hypothetical protein
MDWFEPLMEKFMEETSGAPYTWIEGIANSSKDPIKAYNNIEKYLSKWKFMGRFSIDRFTEIAVSMGDAGLIPIRLKSSEVAWKKGSNLTSGMLNLYYMDTEAELFDREGVISEDNLIFLKEKVYEVQDAVLKVYPNQENKDLIVIISKVCSFRNLFKGARYGGFHHDRELEQIIAYEQSYPLDSLWQELYDIRKAIFTPDMLGEVGGWTGIRKERKKLWLQSGLTGVESEVPPIVERDESLEYLEEKKSTLDDFIKKAMKEGKTNTVEVLKKRRRSVVREIQRKLTKKPN